MDLKQKVIIVTGASSGLGKELALQFVQKGAKVVVAARSADLLRMLVDHIKKGGGEALAVPTDVSRKADVHYLIQRTVQEFGRLDMVVSNAGVSTAQGNLVDNNEQDIQHTINTNFMAAVYLTRAAVPEMEKAGGGQLVFVSSAVGKRGVPRNAIYCSTKFALQGLTESIRLELKPKKIHVMAVYPSGIDTPFFEKNKKGDKRTYQLHPVDKVARQIVRACEKEKRELLLMWDTKLLHYGNVLFPWLVDRILARVKKV